MNELAGGPAMSKSKMVVRSYKSTRGPRPKQLPVAVSSLRWALARRLLLAIPAGVFLGGMLTTALNLETADPSGDAAMLAGLAAIFRPVPDCSVASGP